MKIDERYIRKIIHIDMDAFYASVEQLDNPELRGKPIAVGGSRERGVVAAASYEAREYGVKSAMPSSQAYQRCRQLIFVKPRFDRYKEISQQIRSIFYDYTDLVEPLSLDEAYLDVTTNKCEIPSATLIASEIRERIKKETGLNASAGISINKFLAKVASDINKPNGQKLIPPNEALNFMEELSIDEFYGVGAKTAERMKRMGIHSGSDLKAKSLQWLVKQFGKSGFHYFNIVRGIQKSKVKPNRIRKSIGAERTFEKDLYDLNDIDYQLKNVTQKVASRTADLKAKGKTVTLKLKYSDFTIQTRSRSDNHFISEEADILSVARSLLNEQPLEQPIRLIGVTLSNLEKKARGSGVQLTLKF
jgi:DNA polymerase-4